MEKSAVEWRNSSALTEFDSTDTFFYVDPSKENDHFTLTVPYNFSGVFFSFQAMRFASFGTLCGVGECYRPLAIINYTNKLLVYFTLVVI